MTAVDLLTTLRARGVAVTRRGDSIRCQPAGDLIDDLREGITRHKTDLLELLDRERFAVDPRPDLGDDSVLWTRLLGMAHALDGDDPSGLFGVLHGLRCEGARLVIEHGRMRLDGGEMDDEYSAFRSWLVPHVPSVKDLFAVLESAQVA